MKKLFIILFLSILSITAFSQATPNRASCAVIAYDCNVGGTNSLRVPVFNDTTGMGSLGDSVGCLMYRKIDSAVYVRLPAGGTAKKWVRLLKNGQAINSVAWGQLTGTLSNQTDLQNALNLKADQQALVDTAAVLRAYIDATTSSVKTLYNADDTVSSNRTVELLDKNLTIKGEGATVQLSQRHANIYINNENVQIQAGNSDGSLTKNIHLTGDSPGDGIRVSDDIDSIGYIYQGDYSANGLSNPRWIPDIAAVRRAINDSSGNYIRIVDSASMLSPYIRAAGYGLTKSSQSLRLDSATVFPQIRATIPAGSTYYNSNIGSSYRLVVPNTNNIKTLSVGYGILNDSTTNANSVTQKVDTTTLFPAVRNTVTTPNIQQVLTAGDTTLRKIVLKDTGSVSADHALNWFDWRPSNYNTTYPGYGTQGLFNSGFSFNMINPGSSRPDVVSTIFGYNVALQGGSPLIGTEASYAQVLEDHFEVGADQLFERYDQIIPTGTGVAKRPFGYYMNKVTGFSRFNSEIDAFNLFTWNKDTVGFAISSGGGGLALNTNGNFVFSNARKPNNQITTTLADDGPTISGTGINSNSRLSFISPIRINTGAGGSGGCLQIDGIPDNGNGIQIATGTTSGSIVPINIIGTASGMGTIMQNLTSDPAAETYKIQRSSAGILTQYMIDGANKFYKWQFNANAGNGRLVLSHNNGSVFTVDGANQRVGISNTAPDSTVDIAGSLRTTAGVRHDGLPRAVGTKALRYNPSTGTLSYADTTVAATSGVYTPTYTTGSGNISTASGTNIMWFRVDNKVTVSGSISIGVTTALTPTNLVMTLPIASDLQNATELAGGGTYTGSSVVENVSVFILPDTSADAAQLKFYPSTTNAGILSFTFTYLVR